MDDIPVLTKEDLGEFDSEGFLSTMNEVNSEMLSLTNFGSVLSNTIGSLNKNVARMQHTYGKTNESILSLRSLAEKQNKIINKLTVDLAEQRLNTQEAMRSATNIEFAMAKQVANSTETLHKEMLVQRTATKMELNALRSSMAANVNDAIYKYQSQVIKLDGESFFGHEKMSSPAEMWKEVAIRIAKIEKSLASQMEVNIELMEAIKNDDSWSKAYNAISDQMTMIESQLREVREENTQLKDNLISGLEEKIKILMEDGGGMKKGKRKRRGPKFAPPPSAPEDSSMQDAVIMAPLESYTIEESDFLAERITALEAALQSQQASTMLLFKNIKGDIEDINIDVMTLKNKLNQLIAAQEAEEDDQVSNPYISKLITSSKLLWIKLQDDLGYGLDAIDENLKGSGQNKAMYEDLRDSAIVVDCRQLLEIIDEVIISYEPKDTVMETVRQLYSKLDMATQLVVRLLESDDLARSKSLITLDSFPLLDRSISLREKLEAICKASFPILDEMVDKITLRRRLEKIESLLPAKVERTLVNDLAHELRSSLNGKTDKNDFEAVVRTKASMAELLHLKGVMLKELDFFRSNGVEVGVGTAGIGGPAQKVESEDVKELSKRFDLVFDHFQDLQKFCAGFVPREEVELAMKALLNEVKYIKLNAVTAPVLKEGLKLKADASEMNRVVEALTFSIGSLQGKNNAAAVHKCLMCDKPVNTINPKGGPSASRNQIEDNPAAMGTGGESALSFRPATSAAKLAGYGRLGSPDSKERARVTSEIAIMRSSIDLPPLQTSASTGNVGQYQKHEMGKPTPSNISPPYKNRIKGI